MLFRSPVLPRARPDHRWTRGALRNTASRRAATLAASHGPRARSQVQGTVAISRPRTWLSPADRMASRLARVADCSEHDGVSSSGFGAVHCVRRRPDSEFIVGFECPVPLIYLNGIARTHARHTALVRARIGQSFGEGEGMASRCACIAMPHCKITGSFCNADRTSENGCSLRRRVDAVRQRARVSTPLQQPRPRSAWMCRECASEIGRAHV